MILYILHRRKPLEGRHLLQKSLRSCLAPVYTEFLHGLLGKLLAVFLVDDGEVLRITNPVDLLTQEFSAETVDCAYEIVNTSSVNHRGYAPFHLLRGLVGEGKAEDIARTDTDFIDYVGVAVGEHTGFAGTGARDNADVPLGGFDCLLLLLIQDRGIAHLDMTVSV